MSADEVRKAAEFLGFNLPGDSFLQQARLQALAAGLEALGLQFVVPEAERLPQLNAVYVPDGVDDAAVRRRLLRSHRTDLPRRWPRHRAHQPAADRGIRLHCIHPRLRLVGSVRTDHRPNHRRVAQRYLQFCGTIL